MSQWILLISLLSLSPANAVNLERQHQADRKVILTSRGDAAYANSRTESNANADIGPWELRKSPADPTGIVQPPLEDMAGDIESAENHTGVQFIQEVNGSTPTGWMQLGTPPKWLLVIYDTGSDKLVAKTWDTIHAELESVDQGIKGMVLPSNLIYSHNSSSTYRRKYSLDPTTKKMVPEKNEIAYGSGVAITDEGNDTVKIGTSFIINNFSLSEITADSLQLLHTSKGISGVLGLQHMKNRSLGRSLFSRFRDDGTLTSFGYCRGTGDNGTFLWGDTSTEGDAVDVIGEMHWAVKLGRIHVNGNGSHVKKAEHSSGNSTDVIIKVPASSLMAKRTGSQGWSWPFSGVADRPLAQQTENDRNADDSNDGTFEGRIQDPSEDEASDDTLNGTVPCADNKCTGILDTGSNIIAGPTGVMKAISDKVAVENDCSNFDSLPTISIVFGGKNVTVHPEGYVMKVPMPKWSDIMGGGDGMGGGQLQDGAAQDDEAHGEGEGALGGAGLEEQGTRQRSKLGWKAVFEHLHRTRGIDLSIHDRRDINASAGGDNATHDEPQFMCMPALVPLDKHTKFGPLYVVGTPLLQTHYARWSWKTGDASPKIFIKKLADCDTCKNVHPTPVNETAQGYASLEAIAPAAVPLLRSERPAQFEMPRSRGPLIREIEDIRFPHWANDLEDFGIV